jgi:hypothetical protein
MGDVNKVINRLFTEDGITYRLDNYTDLYCRESGFITDPTFDEYDRSRALRNYFEYGRFYEALMDSPETNLPYQVSLMEKWMETYKQYLKESELKAVTAYYEKIKGKLSK